MTVPTVKSVSGNTHPQKPVQVKCMARTRIPTPHGPAFLHLYHNNRDDKEHLAIVIDPAQFSETPSHSFFPPIRSQSLEAVWSENETEMDRITRGAYVGRLSPTSQHPSDPPSAIRSQLQFPATGYPAPLIRVHSECFTGETVGSMRCDCGEQLEEAIRRISQPINIPTALDPHAVTILGRGAVVYLRQEGRGIGLLSKIQAYNLQDLGHDTVTANLLLGHQADERGYEIAGAILHDLGLGGDETGVRVLTNNPDKIQALENAGVRVVERVAMIPRSWQCRYGQSAIGTPNSGLLTPSEGTTEETLMHSNSVHRDDLDKYLRTKITRMGHILPLWMDDPQP